MSIPAPSGSASGRGAVVLAGRLWAGGVATGCIAALVAAVGVLLCSSVLDVEPRYHARVVDHRLTCSELRDDSVRGGAGSNWGGPPTVGHDTSSARLLWLACRAGHGGGDGDAVRCRGQPSGKISTALINLAVGIAIGTFLTAVLSRTVTDAERSWQRR